MRLIVAILLASLASTPALAQTQHDLNEGEYAKLKAADKAMNAAYAKMMAKISSKGQSALREAQRTWVRFRDQECDFETLGSIDGSIHPMAVAICQTRMTESRTAEINAQLNCKEGDVGCGSQ